MDKILKYFNAEKSESFFFVLVGLLAIAFAIYFFVKIKEPYYNGLSYPLIAIALIQITVGTSVYFRSPKDITRVSNIMKADKTKILSEEIPRMEKVMKNFVLYRWIELALFIMGLLLFFVLKNETVWKGFGLGLSIQAAFMLLLDFFAENRGKEYLNYLQNLN